MIKTEQNLDFKQITLCSSSLLPKSQKKLNEIEIKSNKKELLLFVRNKPFERGEMCNL